MERLKVSSRSSPNAVAGALAGVIRSHGQADIQVVGAGALNQAIKAIAIARSYLADAGADLICIPSFAEISIDGESRTAIRLLVERRSAPSDERLAPPVELRSVPLEPVGVAAGAALVDLTPT